MQRIFDLLFKIRYFFLFLLLEAIAFALVVGQYRYHHSVMHSVAGDVFYSVSSVLNSWTQFFSLSRENERLLAENAQLKAMMTQDDKVSDQRAYFQPTVGPTGDAYHFIPAMIVKNSTRKTKNYIVLNRGSLDGVQMDDGVITQNGVLGVIVQVSPHFSVCRSILHTDSYVSVRFKKNEYFGSVEWKGDDPTQVDMIDVSRVADVQIGDTVITDRRSSLFPEGLLVGTVQESSVGQSDFYDIKLKLAEDYASLRGVYIIRYTHRDELNKALEYDE